MKAIPTPTRKQCERVAQEVQQEAMLSVYDNVAMLLIALGRRYGFRQKRIAELINAFNEVSVEYLQHADDGVFDEMLEKELNALGIEKSVIYQEKDIKIQIQKQKKRRESQQLSIKEQIEAERLREKMFALRDFTEGKL
jgi:predicted ribosome quality control (RQC) complex YloA/Tae2 family protein